MYIQGQIINLMHSFQSYYHSFERKYSLETPLFVVDQNFHREENF